MKYLKTINELKKMKPNDKILDSDKLEGKLDKITQHDNLVNVEVGKEGDFVSFFKIDILFDINKSEYKMTDEETQIFESLKWFNKNGLFDKNNSHILLELGKDDNFISTYEKPDDKIFYTSVINGAYFSNYEEINRILKKYT